MMAKLAARAGDQNRFRAGRVRIQARRGRFPTLDTVPAGTVGVLVEGSFSAVATSAGRLVASKRRLRACYGERLLGE